MAAPEGSVAVRFHPEIGLAVYVQSAAGALIVWSWDHLGGQREAPTLLTGKSVGEYGEVVYEPPA